MINICNQFITLLQGYSPLTAIISSKNMFVGPVDIVKEQQNTIGFPMLTIMPVSEVWATVPLDTRMTRIQIDIWSRNNEMEAQNSYEQIIAALNYQKYDSGTSHIFWQRGDGATSISETDVRLWRYTADMLVWSYS